MSSTYSLAANISGSVTIGGITTCGSVVNMNDKAIINNTSGWTGTLLKVGGNMTYSQNYAIAANGSIILSGRIYFYYNWAIIANSGGNMYFYYGLAPESDNSGPYISSNGVFTNGSDRKWKNNIEDISFGLNEVLKLRPVSYNFIKQPEARKHLGFIAQELQEQIPTIVEYDSNNDGLCLSYTEIIPILTKAIQEQQAEINLLKEQMQQILLTLKI
jgi:hypothetical protein